MTTIHRHETGRIVKAEGLPTGVITAIASDATPDLYNDVVVPEGAEPPVPGVRQCPVLFAHDATEPVGSATWWLDTAARCIRCRITFATTARAQEIYQLVRDGAISAVSVGFDSLQSAPRKDGGRTYEKWRLLEISLVSVPANPSARITSKSGTSARELSRAERLAEIAALAPRHTEPDHRPQALKDASRYVAEVERARVAAGYLTHSERLLAVERATVRDAFGRRVS